MSEATTKKVSVPIDLLRGSVEIGKGAAALCQKVAARKHEVGAKAVMAANQLVEHNIVDSMDKAATVELLKDHGRTLEILARLSKQASRPRPLGAGVNKEAAQSFDPQNKPEPESHRVFAEQLHTASP